MNSIKTISFGNFPVSFQNNGYLNATVVAAHFNRRVGNYLKSERTQEYIAALAEKLSVTPKRATEDNQIVIIKQGGTEQGTWLHPKLAVDFARWLDPKFAVWCDEQIEQILSGSLKAQPKTTADERTGLRQAVSALVGKCGIDYGSAYNMVHQRFGVAAIEDIPADKLNDAVQYVHTLNLHSGLNGEVLDRLPEKLQAQKIAIDERTLISIGRLLLYAQEQRCFVSRYLPAFENLGIGGRGKLWSFVHDTDPVFEHIRRFFTGQCPALGHWAKDSDLDWLHRRILSTAEA